MDKKKTEARTGLDREADSPLYRQVRRTIEGGIASGRFDLATPLPSSRALALEMGVSRNTVNSAYQELLSEGFVSSRPRSGLYVNQDLLSHIKLEHRDDNAPVEAVNWPTRLHAGLDVGLQEVQKIPDWHQFRYPFIAGQIEAPAFPALAWSRVLRESLHYPHLHFSLRDGISADDPLFVEALRSHILPARGIEAHDDEMLITMGSQEGLWLLSQALLGPGSVVAVEEPGYLDARHVFQRAGASLLPLLVDSSGVVPPDDLGGVDLLHLTPSHQHPTNVTLSIGRRRQLMLLANRCDAIIVEDDYDSELRYQGSPSPSLKALDETGRVVYLGTFSKFLAPGLRLGYLVGDARLIAHLREQRRYSIRHPPGHVQRAMALFILSGQYHRAVRHHRIALRRKWERMHEALALEFPFAVSNPPGGVSIWVEGPPGFDGVALADRLLDQGVIIERGDIYFLDPSAHRNCIRLGFSAIPLDAIRSGLHIVGEAAKEQLVSG